MRSSNEPGDNILDSRDVIRRYEELKSDAEDMYEAEIERLVEELCDDETSDEEREKLELSFRNKLPLDEFVDLEAVRGEVYAEDYIKYRDFVEEAEDEVIDWSYGATLIHDEYFETYAEELANDLYDIEDHWPYTCIDWEQAAEELKQDYSQIEWDGNTYYYR